MRCCRGHAIAVGAYVALTVLFTWPIAAAPGSWVPHDLGDPLLSTWALWWNAMHLPFTDTWWNGAVFYPARGVLALSDHRVGIGLITTPLVLAGVSPLAAHNVAWLLSYVLSAVAAYALTYALTGRRTAAFVGGLVYGFHPFRAEHLPHLELLSSYWLPVVLLALHRWASTGDRRWLPLLSVALTLAAFTTGYYFFFLGVLIGLWLFWFVPWDLPPARYGELALALVLPFVPLAPVLLRYRAIHQQYGLARTFSEIETFSADVRGLVTAPEPLLVWNTPAGWYAPEGALFPGLTAVAVVTWALVTDRHTRRSVWWPLARRAVLALAILAGAAALLFTLSGPVRLDLGPLRISVSETQKPISLATLLLLIWVLTSSRVREARRARDPLMFYALATVAMWLFALGPTARLMGERLFYRAPYSWLMLLPGFGDGFRAPARFAMLAALCLAAAAAAALARITARLTPRAAVILTWATAAGVLVDGLVVPFPFEPAPAALTLPAGVPGDAAVLELPTGVFEDATAMYHATQHGRPVVNGLSGYDPPHYAVLRAALGDGDTGPLDVLAVDRPLVVLVRRDPEMAGLVSRLPQQSRARAVARTGTHDVFLLAATPRERTRLPDASREVPIAALDASAGRAQLPLLRDHDRRTAWATEGPQRGNEHVTVTLAAQGDVSGIVLALGQFTPYFPRGLAISVSDDGVTWQGVWDGPLGARAMAAALDDPLEIRIPLEFPAVRARHVRLTQTGRSPEREWAMAELSVFGPPP
jgi:hypothetical protein